MRGSGWRPSVEPSPRSCDVQDRPRVVASYDVAEQLASSAADRAERARRASERAAERARVAITTQARAAKRRAEAGAPSERSDLMGPREDRED